MEAEGAGAGHQAEDGEGPASAGGPGSQDGRGGHEALGRVSRREAGAFVMGVVQIAPVLDAPLPGANVEPAPLVRIPRPVPLQFSILVSFTSSLEAEIACRLLTPHGQTQPAAVHQEIMVSSCLLSIRLTAEDMDQLQLSISSYLHELFLLIETMQHVLPPFLSVLTPGQ